MAIEAAEGLEGVAIEASVKYIAGDE